ncbi:hypothetical protein [Psychromicrobium xiongbiense]|uniref:hypothetical protein n=1 Tax=Psychromicrobium xiongbiense TaxID=3051184 RepID=UPI0025567775|nr:hypothetical protein [Psychromicrobium sp. YIM S02556]
MPSAANALAKPMISADSASIISVVAAVLDDRNQQVVERPAVAAMSVAQMVTAKHEAEVRSDYAELGAFKVRLANFGQSYTAVKTAIKSHTIQMNGNLASVRLVELTELSYAPDATGVAGPPYVYEYPQIVKLVRGATGWVVDSVEPQDAGALPPSTASPRSSKGQGSKFQGALANVPGANPVSAQAGVPVGYVPNVKTLTQSNGPTTYVAGYDYGAMVSYATTY